MPEAEYAHHTTPELCEVCSCANFAQILHPFPLEAWTVLHFQRTNVEVTNLINNSNDGKIGEQLEKIVRLVIVAFQASGHGVTQPQPHLCGLP
jgi:hypothetical protein